MQTKYETWLEALRKATAEALDASEQSRRRAGATTEQLKLLQLCSGNTFFRCIVKAQAVRTLSALGAPVPTPIGENTMRMRGDPSAYVAEDHSLIFHELREDIEKAFARAKSRVRPVTVAEFFARHQ